MTTTPGSSRRPSPHAPPAAPAPPNPSPDAADQALVRAIQSGDPRAWSRLIALYQDRLFAVCLRMVNDRDAAADLTQDTFVKVIQGLGSYDGRSRLSTWLIRIAMNTCLSWKRSQKLRRHISLDAPDGVPTPRNHAPDPGRLGTQGRSGRTGWELRPDQGVELHEQHDRVAAALASLNAEQRAILVLRDVQGLDYEQISQVLDIAVGTVKSRLFRARLALREVLEGGGAADRGGRDER